MLLLHNNCISQTYGLVQHESGKWCSMRFSVPEIKIFLLLSYYTVLGIVYLVNYCIIFRENQIFNYFLQEYITCQALGDNPECEVFRKEFEKHVHPEPLIIISLLIGFLPWFYLMLFISVNDIKNIVQKITSFCHCDSQINTH